MYIRIPSDFSFFFSLVQVTFERAQNDNNALSTSPRATGNAPSRLDDFRSNEAVEPALQLPILGKSTNAAHVEREETEQRSPLFQFHPPFKLHFGFIIKHTL